MYYETSPQIVGFSSFEKSENLSMLSLHFHVETIT